MKDNPIYKATQAILQSAYAIIRGHEKLSKAGAELPLLDILSTELITKLLKLNDVEEFSVEASDYIYELHEELSLYLYENEIGITEVMDRFYRLLAEHRSVEVNV